MLLFYIEQNRQRDVPAFNYLELNPTKNGVYILVDVSVLFQLIGECDC